MWKQKGEDTVMCLERLSSAAANAILNRIKYDRTLCGHIDKKIEAKRREYESGKKSREETAKRYPSLSLPDEREKEIFEKEYSPEAVEESIRGGISSEYLKLSIYVVVKVVSRLYPGEEEAFVENLMSVSMEAGKSAGLGEGLIFSEYIKLSVELMREYYTGIPMQEGEIINDAIVKKFCDEIAPAFEADCSEELYKLLASGIASGWQKIVEDKGVLREMGILCPGA